MVYANKRVVCSYELTDWVLKNPKIIGEYMELYIKLCPLEAKFTLYTMFDDLVIETNRSNIKLMFPDT